MEIIDVHAHVYPKIAGINQSAPISSESWGKARVGNQLIQLLPPAFEHTNSPVEMLLGYMDWCGISKALLMPNPCYGYHNDYFIECVQKYPQRFRGVALVNLLKGEEAARKLAQIYDTTPLFGFKVETYSTFQCAPGKRLADKDLLPVWDCLNQYHQPAFLHLFTNEDMEDLEKLMNLFPAITWIICHMGADACFTNQSPGNYDTLLQWVKTRSNMYLDTSSISAYFDVKEEYPYPSAVQVLEKAWKQVGAEKLLWASDFPGMLSHATLQELIHLITRQCHIPEKEIELIMGQNARHLFFE